MAGNSKPTVRKTAKKAAAKPRTPIKMVVRRGALERFENLKKKTAHLEVEVVWDQRNSNPATEAERRLHERRRTPPFTWDVADFVVATPANVASAKKRRKPPTK